MLLLWSAVFPVLRLHTSRRPPRHSMPQGPRSRWSRLRPGEVPPRYNALLGRRDSDPLLFGFFMLLVFVLGHRDPKAYLFAGATVVSPLGSHTHGLFCFPRFFFVFSLFFSLSLSLSLLLLSGCWPLGPRPGSRDAIGRK